MTALTELDEAERHRTVAGGFTALVNGVEDWEAQTPVGDWVARDVVRHHVDWLPGLLAGGSTVVLTAGPPADDDPVAAWAHLNDQVQALLDDPATAEVEYSSDFMGTLPVPQVIDRFYTADVFMHSWDLARASGQPIDLDEGYAAGLLQGLQGMDQEVLRGSGQFGQPQPVPPDATKVDELIAFIGRDPRWSPQAS